MIRLFATLNILLITVLVLYVLSVNGLMNWFIFDIRNDYNHELGKGTLHYLNKTMRGRDAAQRLKRLQAIQQEFPYELRLAAMDSLGFSEREIKRLNSDLIVGQEVDDITRLYARLPDTQQVWVFALDIDTEQDEINTVAGTFALLQEELANNDNGNPGDYIAQEVAPRFGFDVRYQALDADALSDQHQQRLESGKTVYIKRDGENEFYYQRIANTENVLRLGPFDLPWIAGYINKFALAGLLLLLLLSTALWLRPLWRDLQHLKRAAEQFGEGDYNVRVLHSKHARLAPITSAFNTMAEQTSASIRSQKELTSAVSHELRTPVARMRFALDMLEESETQQDWNRHIKGIGTDIDELDTLLDELLSYARLDRPLDQREQALTLKLIPVTVWLNDSMALLKPLAGDKQLSWKCDGIDATDMAEMDEALMTRMLSNLVQNALRHAKSRVDVTLSQESGEWLLSVDDDGPGIPEDERERLFEVFATADQSRNKTSQGFGLGLAIVKRIVTLHQGRAEILDSPLGGARVLVRWREDN